MEDEGSTEQFIAPIVNTKIAPVLPVASTKETRVHTIPNFLNRIYTIENFIWSKTDTLGTVLKTYRFPDILLSNPAISAKIRNFYGFRAGVELIVLVNKQPFQAGNLMISYLPNARYNTAKNNMHLADLKGMVSRSGAPRTNLDLMDGTRANLSVPYASPFIYYNLITGDGTIGDFHISVYSPLRDVATSGTVSVQVMARFINVDLQFPTGTAPIATGPLQHLTRAFNSLSTNPSREKVKEIQKQTKNILESIDNKQFKFQMNSVSCQNFKQKALPNMATSTDPNQTHMLSLSSDNFLIKTNIGEASQDEMNFNSILSIPCYFSNFNIINTDTAGKNVYSTIIGPSVTPNITNEDQSISTDYLNWLSIPFKKWRGSINFHFRAVKTQFHSLRIRVWFCPGASSVTDIDRNSCISKIVDLKELNQFDFTVPYIHPYPWLNTVSGANSLGILGVDVLNQMVNPSSVDSTINVIVERSAGPDFQFNLPSTITYFPFNPTPLPAPIVVPTIKKKEVPSVATINDFKFQMNSQSDQDFDRTGHDDEAYIRPQNALQADKLTLGQSINHVSQMICRSTTFALQKKILPTLYTFTVQPGTGTITETTSAVITMPAFSSTITLTDSNNFTVTNVAPLLVETDGRVYALPTGDVEAVSWSSTTHQILVYSHDHLGNEFIWQLVTAYTNNTTYSTTIPATNIPTATIVSTTLGNSNPSHIIPHAIGITQFDSNNNLLSSGLDNVSYFASVYSFARGGINLRIVTTGDPYIISVVPDNDINQEPNQSFAPLSTSLIPLTLTDLQRTSSTIQQAVNPNVEGYGELTVPFYSSTHCYSISPSLTFAPDKNSVDFTLPDTQALLLPLGSTGGIVLYRAASHDFEFSYLSGPPLVKAI